MNNTMIYLVGFPGAGKYTIAKEIVKRANFRLVDNHLINNPVFSLIKADGKTKLPDRVWKNVGEIWDAVLDTIIHISPRDYSFVLTNALFESKPADRAWWKEIEKTALARNALFVPVRLLCSIEELQKRIGTNDRVDRFKEIDPESPARYVKNDEVVKIEHPNALTLDVSNLSSAHAAEIILDHANAINK